MAVEEGEDQGAKTGAPDLLTEPAMSKPYLPRETLDYIIDLLHDERETLKQCCLVSKSWAPRTRKHLFAHIRLYSASDLESWKKTFPDVTNSPGCHARGLLVGCPWLVEAADAEEGGWIRAFSGAKRLEITVRRGTGDWFLGASEDPLAPFHNFSPTLKSLHVDLIVFPYQRLSDLVCSFPLLENLSLAGHYEPWFDDDDSYEPQTVIPSTSPALSGNLDFHVLGGVENAARQLLDLPNGLHFRYLSLSWDLLKDTQWITELVTTCSHSLEFLDITQNSNRASICI